MTHRTSGQEFEIVWTHSKDLKSLCAFKLPQQGCNAYFSSRKLMRVILIICTLPLLLEITHNRIIDVSTCTTCTQLETINCDIYYLTHCPGHSRLLFRVIVDKVIMFYCALFLLFGSSLQWHTLLEKLSEKTGELGNPLMMRWFCLWTNYSGACCILNPCFKHQIRVPGEGWYPTFL